MGRNVLPLKEPGIGQHCLRSELLVLRLVEIPADLLREISVNPTGLVEEEVLLHHRGDHEGEHVQEHCGLHGCGFDHMPRPLENGAARRLVTLFPNGAGRAVFIVLTVLTRPTVSSLCGIFGVCLQVCNGFWYSNCVIVLMLAMP